MSKKKRSNTGKILNKRATFDYQLGESFVVGIVLKGRETKSLRLGHGQLRGAYVTVKGNELWLINAAIHGTNGIPIEESEVTQARKLLAKRREIEHIIAAKNQGMTIIPLEILTNGRYIKLRIALGKGRKQHDKRSVIRERDVSKNARREMKRYR